MRRSLLTRLAGVAAGALLLAGGCTGDDDDSSGGPLDQSDGASDETTTTEAGVAPELAAYCDAALALETIPDPPLDASSSDSEAAAWVRDELQPRVEAVVAAAPAEIADDLITQAAAVENAAATGDFGYFGGADVDAAEARTHAFDLANCGWNQQPVEATEYSFGDVPASLAAGPTSFELTNVGAEVHEIVLARKNPGVTESVADILARPEDEARSMITEVGSVYADPGEADYRVVDLEPGDYVMVCFVPVGVTSSDVVAPEGPPHHTQGMVAEFTVT